MSDDQSAESARSGSASVEVNARTVDEAIARGLVRLGGLSRNEVDIDVVSEGKAGLLGFGAEEAVVRLTPKAEVGPAAPTAAIARQERRRRRRGRGRQKQDGDDRPQEPSARSEPSQDARREAPSRDARDSSEATSTRATETQPVAKAEPRSEPRTEAPQEERADRTTAPPAKREYVGALGAAAGDDVVEIAREATTEMLRLLGYDSASLEQLGGLLPEDMDDEDSVVLCVRGEGTERLLADEGRALRALQFLTRLVVSRQTEEWSNLLIDVQDDRRRQVQELIALAQQSADLVEREGRPVALPPMGAYERRVVHLALRDRGSIATQSIGKGDRRKVTVRRKDQLLPEL